MDEHHTVNHTTGVQDKFGRVFLRQHDAPKNPEYQQLKGLRFSNLQLRILSADAEDIMYTGRRYSVDFLGNRLRLPIPLGLNKIAETKNVQKAYDRELEIAKELKLVDKEDEPEVYSRKCDLVRNSKMSLFYALANPDMDIMEQDFLIEAATIAYIDDLLENFGSSGNKIGKPHHISGDTKPKRKFPYRFTSRMCYILYQCFQTDDNAKGDPFEEMLDNPSKLYKNVNLEEKDKNRTKAMTKSADSIEQHHPWIHCVLNLTSRIRKVAIEAAKANGCSASAYLGRIAMEMDLACFEASDEWCTEIEETFAENNFIMLPSLVKMRKYIGGGMLFLEANLLQNGIHLGNEVRTCAVFRLIVDQIELYFQKVYELVSFEKEMRGDREEWKSNEACILHKLNGLTVQEAKGKMTSEANKALERIERISKLLLEMWKGREQEENIVKFVRIIWQNVTGFIQWVVLIERYHRNVVLDCYID